MVATDAHQSNFHLGNVVGSTLAETTLIPPCHAPTPTPEQ
jgi:hypothetical protein